MVKNNMIMTELEKELAEIFEKIGLNFRERRYYDEIFLSGYACKLIDDCHKNNEEDIERIARFIAGNDFAEGVELKVIYNTVRFALEFANCVSQDEIDYQNEISDNANGGFGIAIPLMERVFYNKGFGIYHMLFPDFDAEIFSSKEMFDLLRPIKGKINFIIENNFYRESLEIRFDDSIRTAFENSNHNLVIPERSKMLPQILIYRKNNHYIIELEKDFQDVIDEFNTSNKWDLDDEVFKSVFPHWCRPVSKKDLKKVYELFTEFVTKYNNCKNTKEIAAAICTLIHAY